MISYQYIYKFNEEYDVANTMVAAKDEEKRNNNSKSHIAPPLLVM